MKKQRLISLSVIMLVTTATGVAAELDRASASAVQNFMEANQLNERWQGEPLRQLDSSELRTAYGDREFFFTFKAPPVPPGAPMPELIEKHKAAMAEYKEKHSLRLTMGVDKAQNVASFEKAQDFNQGLMKVRTDADAKIAAAAILSLIGNEEVYPKVIKADEITVTATGSGWTCKLKQTRGFDGTVVFDQSGKVVSATKTLNYTPPLPS